MGESTRSTVTAEEEAKQKEALNATLKEYISEWRKTREKEEEELKKLKEKQAKRKEIRAEQEKKLNQAKKVRRMVARRLPPRRRFTRRKRRRRRTTMRRSKSASLNLRSAETFLVGKFVLPSPPPAQRQLCALPDCAFSTLEDFVL